MDHDLKHCPICNNDLPVGDFGISRARRDGRNLYCKVCIRAKVAESRRILKEYKSARNRVRESITAQLGVEFLPINITKRETPVDRVREAIRSGAQTQREIAQETRLGKDEVGDALTVLLLWNHEIKSALRGDTRIYFFPESKPEVMVQRKQDVPSGFHCLYELGPGSKRAIG